jgi:hypothetical protein
VIVAASKGITAFDAGLIISHTIDTIDHLRPDAVYGEACAVFQVGTGSYASTCARKKSDEGMTVSASILRNAE